jgi:hypothetical protein
MLSHPLRLAAAAATLAVASWASPPAAAGPASEQSAPAMQSLEVLSPGSRGVARTVLSGTEISEFDVEILSVVRRVGPGRDLILAKAVGEEIERLGVAQGMSGSPVYVDGELVGALSSTWAFAKEPLFGITPAGQMAREAEWSWRVADGASTAPGLDAGRGFLEGRAPPARDGAAGFAPIGSPLVLSGFDRRVVELAAERFEPWGFTVTEGGAAGGAGQRGGDIRPGATIGVRLAGGDVEMTAFGTVTWVEGDRVLAWGHPFFQMGDVEMPLVNGFVHATVPSQQLSFKLSGGGEVVGTCTGDRASGVYGVLGRTPRVTVFDLTITALGEAETFHFELARNRFLTPPLVGITAANAVLKRAGAVAEETVRFRQRIVLEDGRDTMVETLIAGDQTLGQVTELLGAATRAIALNPFEEVEIARIEGELIYDPGVRLGVITELAVDDDTPEPGDVLRGHYTVRDWRGAERAHRFAIPVPKDAREGKYLLLAADAQTAERFEAERAPRLFAPRDLDEYLERLRRLRQTDEVHLHLYRGSRGVLIDGTPLPDLPPSVLAVMRGPNRSGNEDELPAELVHEQRVPAGRFVMGGHDLLLEIRKETR